MSQRENNNEKENNDSNNSEQQNIEIIKLDDDLQLNNNNSSLESSILKKSSEKGGYRSSIFNITNTIIGGGILALPYGLKESGLLLGTMFIIIQAFIVVFSASLLTRSSKIIKPNNGIILI